MIVEIQIPRKVAIVDNGQLIAFYIMKRLHDVLETKSNFGQI